MTRARVLAAIRQALGDTGRPTDADAALEALGDPGEEARRFDGVGGLEGFAAQLEAVGGVVLQAENDWRPSVESFAQQMGLKQVFAGSGLNVEGLSLAPVGADEAASHPDHVLGLGVADWGVASLGSVVLDAQEELLPSVSVSVALVVLERQRVVERLADLPLGAGRRMIVTGPARTADIEKKIVLGAHGPKAFGVVLVDEVS